MMARLFCRQLDNFGDRPLNEWLIPRLVPGIALDGSPDRLLFGIGTLFGNRAAKADLLRLPDPAAPRIVFCTGAYGRDWTPGPRSLHVLCVRGRFTCRSLGLPISLAAADGAILLPDYLPLTPSSQHEQAAVERNDWNGEERPDRFSTRTTDVEAFVRRLLGFRQVTTQSLHATIIADIYGIPWLPMRWEPKWKDHFEQLGFRRRPTNFTLSPRSALAERQAQLREKVAELNRIL